MRKRNSVLALFLVPVLTLSLGAVLSPGTAGAALVTFSGTVTYAGARTADTLYVVVLEPLGNDVSFLKVGTFPVGSPPLSQPFDLEFDNALATGPVVVAAVLDLLGGGLETAGNGVVGWYGEGLEPEGLTPDQDRTGLDFSLPLGEIHGTVTFRPAQTEAFMDATPDLLCSDGGFRPRYETYAEGAFAILGVYPGTYCIRAYTEGETQFMVCSGDPTCLDPVTVTISGSETVTGVDLDFSGLTPVESVTWGALKGLY